MTLPAHKNSNDKPRPIPNMSARKLARFRSENAGAYPRSSITPKKAIAGSFNGRTPRFDRVNLSSNLSPAAKSRKPIPSRKKRSTTPMRSKPFEGRLDKLSHWTASGNLKLLGADKEAMREKIFERAGIATRCEGKAFMERRCIYRATEWSHKPCIHIKVGSGHGHGFKCDSELCGAAECERCHRREHGQY